MSAEYKVSRNPFDDLETWSIKRIAQPKRSNGIAMEEVVYTGFETREDALRLADFLQSAEIFRLGVK